MLAVKQKLARGEVASMVLVNYANPNLVEHLGKLGFDIAFLDCEKGSAGMERIEEMCRGARAAGIAALVRPWSGDAGLVSRYLDVGADGIMQAAIDTPEAARALVDAVRYARFKDYDDKLVVGMIESPEAIRRLPELLQVDGIDVWFIGPNDLAHRMGFPGQGTRPEVRETVERTLRQIREAGRIGGTLATPETVPALVAAGARVLLTRSSELLARGASEFQAQVARAAPATSAGASR